MRRLTAFFLCVLLLVATAACKKPKRVRATSVDDEEGVLRSVVHVADPKAAIQLTRGFHELEGNAWRWTKGKFSVTLRPPMNAAKDGAYLVVKLSIAETTIKNLGAVRLSANLNGQPVEGETYDKTGDFIYKREIPASSLQQEAVGVEFSLDKFLEAGRVEGRELGIIVHMIGLEGK